MREARIILPIVSLEREHTTVHKGLRRLLCQSFGGCTVTQGSGAWVDGEGNTITETVTIYDVAVEPTTLNGARVIQLAHNAASDLNQEAVYVRLPTGNVLILPVGSLDTVDGKPELDMSQLAPYGDHFPPADPQGDFFRAQRESQGLPIDALERPVRRMDTPGMSEADQSAPRR